MGRRVLRGLAQRAKQAALDKQKQKTVLPPSAPLEQRKQIFLPEFTIALMRTPFLPPRFASFYVPLSFNKLDIRDYLNRLYGVKVLAVRSFVEQQKVTRIRKDGRGYGALRRPKSKKKMTVEMKDPFVWPETPEDMSQWEQDQFLDSKRYEKEFQDKGQPDAANEPDEKARETYEEAAADMTEKKPEWRPTWQALGLNYNRPIVGITKPSAASKSKSQSQSESS